MIKRKLDMMQGLVMDVSKRQDQEHSGEFVIKAPDRLVFPIGNYIVVDRLGEPVPHDTVFALAPIKDMGHITVMAWPLLVTFCSEQEWFKVYYHVASKAQNALLRDHLVDQNNILSMAKYDWKDFVWHAPKVNGHDIGKGVVT